MNCELYLAREKIQTSSVNARKAQIPLKTVKATLPPNFLVARVLRHG